MAADGRTTYVVVGGTGGIGSALCRHLASCGARVLVGGRAREKVEALAAEIDGEALAVGADDLEALPAALADAAQRHGGLSGVAHCAGSLVLKPAHLTSIDEFEQLLRTNLVTAFATVRAAAKAMLATGGSIVLVSTAAVRIGLPNHEAIAAAKGGIEGLVRAAAATYAPRGIRVNAVAPGMTRTPLTDRLLKTPKAEELSAAMHPLGRIGEADEVARAIGWLLEPSNAWVTGQILGVDGGLSSLRRP